MILIVLEIEYKLYIKKKFIQFSTINKTQSSNLFIRQQNKSALTESAPIFHKYKIDFFTGTKIRTNNEEHTCAKHSYPA